VVLLAAIVLMAMFNLTMVSPVLPEFIDERFGETDDEGNESASISKAAIGVFTGMEMIAYVIFAPIWGVVSDRYANRRTFALVGLAVSAPLFALMPSIHNFPALVAMRFVQGAFTVAAWSLAMTMALDWAGAENRGRTMGILGAGMMLGMAMGAPVGGVVGERGVEVPFLAASVVFAIALVVGLALLAEPLRRAKVERKKGEAKAQLKKHSELWMPGAYSFVDRFTAGFFITLFPAMLLDFFDFSSGLRGMYLGIFFLPFALFQYPFGRLIDRIGPLPFILGGSVFYGAVMVLVAHLEPGPLAGAMFILGALAAAMLPASLVLVAHMSTPSIHGIAMGLFNALGSVGFAVGLMASGVMADLWDYGTSFAVGGLSVIVVVAVTVVPLLRYYRDRMRRLEPGGA
jgi:MFS family permease